MKPTILLLCALLAGCGAPADRLTDEQAAAGQDAEIEETVPIDIPEPTSAAPPPAPAPSYSALGTEPGWTLTVTPKTMSYEGNYGSVTIEEPTMKRFRPVPGRYAGTRLQLTITAGPCNDGMSERTYRHTVRLVADGQTVDGCGGGTVVAPDPEPAPDPAFDPVANSD